MRRLSRKRAASLPDEQAFRAELMERINHTCEWCGAEPACDKHEIGRGKFRESCRMHWCAVLGLGPLCHGILTRMPSDDATIAGLAILRRSRPEDYSLEKFLELTTPHAPNRITEREVLAWSRRLAA